MPDYDVIILGAGAAGMMAGIEAGRRGRKVLVVDHARDPGEKIRISGGGRCNFTNVNATHTAGRERFLSQNPRFALSALSRYTPDMFIDKVKKRGIKFHEKTLGQLFRRRARDADRLHAHRRAAPGGRHHLDRPRRRQHRKDQ
ncbi:FAD-dependent oxidoreductase [Devosia aurantiaca]|uniref:FAD-dependent oxidoreductase n=1 Tax=Devosia aurantiaca TaxID=2714858 RepID=UPI0022A67680|nr:FAD-dependent oxidoreductase [Devosia aurantiaca]